MTELQYRFEKFERPATLMRDELGKIFAELASKGSDYSVVINRNRQVLHHQAKVLGYEISIHQKTGSNESRVWVLKSPRAESMRGRG